MKTKRWISLLLTLALCLGLLPHVVLATEDTTSESIVLNSDRTVEIGGETYELALAQNTKGANGSFGYWLDPVNRGFIPEAETNLVHEFRYYLVLLDSSRNEATQEVYKQFWNACQMADATISANEQSDSTKITVGAIASYSDDYKYIPVSVTGAQGGTFSVVIKQTDGASCTLYKTFQYTAATQLTSSTDTYSFSIAAGENKFYYIDLGSTRSITVSGSLDGVNGRLVLAQTAEGTGETSLWRNSSGTEITITTDKILLRAKNYGDAAINGSINVEVEQPRLMFRYMNYNNGAWTESTGDLQNISNLASVQLGSPTCVRIYYGTSVSSVPVDNVVSANSDVIGVTPETVNGDTYYALTAQDFGDTVLTCTIGETAHSCKLTVSLPRYGFYSAAERKEEYYLSNLTLSGTDSDPDKIWYISTIDETGNTITAKVGDNTITSVEKDSDDYYVLEITLPTDISGSKYEISVYRGTSRLRRITVSNDGGDQAGGESGQSDYAAYIDDLVIGFTIEQADGDITVISEGRPLFGRGTGADTGVETSYIPATKIKIAAATKSKDSNGTVIYTVDEDATQSLTIQSLWVEVISGDKSTFSWDNTVFKTEAANIGSDYTQLYYRENRDCDALVYAKISGEDKTGASFEKTIRAPISLNVLSGINEYRRTNNDTTAELNEFLKSLASTLDPDASNGIVYHFYLGATTYRGTIVIPEEFQGSQGAYHTLYFYGAPNGKTVINGGINLNKGRVARMENIHFIADDMITNSNGKTSALYGGGLRHFNFCSFYGYDIAVDATAGMINAHQGNVFVNNQIAALISVDDTLTGDQSYRDDWKENTFINNSIAVQILSLNRHISPYYFRIYDSNFINNGTDIDAQCGGTLYMYRNYFGQYLEVDGHRPTPGKYHQDRHNGRKHLRLDELLAARTESKVDGLLMSASAKVYTDNLTEVITNPHWRHPVKGWWSHSSSVSDTFFGATTQAATLMTLDNEAEYQDKLVIDWGDETLILNDESENLLLDASVFQETGKKEIGILDENEKTLGTWTFD